MTGNNKEWIGNCGSDWEMPIKLLKSMIKYAFYKKNLTHKVVKTRRRVVLTSMTISRNVPLNDVDI